MRPGGEPFSHQRYDTGLYSGEFLWKFKKIDATETAPTGNGRIGPIVPEQI